MNTFRSVKLDEDEILRLDVEGKGVPVQDGDAVLLGDHVVPLGGLKRVDRVLQLPVVGAKFCGQGQKLYIFFVADVAAK